MMSSLLLVLIFVSLIFAVPTSAMSSECEPVRACLNHSNCRDCFTALPHAQSFSKYEARTTQIAFFEQLLATPSCDPSVTNSSMMILAFEALNSRFNYGVACDGIEGYDNACQQASYRCFLDPNCRTCLNDLYRFPNNSSAVFGSPACSATPESLFGPIEDAPCFGFPTCTFLKRVCHDVIPFCAGCLETLQRGNGTAAAQECQVGPAAELMNVLVNQCVKDDTLGCNFFVERCAQSPECWSCLTAVRQAPTTADAIHVFGTEVCAAVRVAPSFLNDRFVSPYISCPNTFASPCRESAIQCAAQGTGCLACLEAKYNSSAPQPNQTQCDTLFTLYAITVSCDDCPASIATANLIVTATMIVGAISVFACCLVALVIIAYSTDQIAIRDRFLLGLMFANALYSAANIIPINRLSADSETCGFFVLSMSMVRFGRSLWFLGKYSLVSFELCILAASVWVLSRGALSLARVCEVVIYFGSLAAGCVACTVFYINCKRINDHGYNQETQYQALYNAYRHINMDDDLDDDSASRPAAIQFDAARDEYDSLLKVMLQVWLGLLGVAILFWIGLRWTYVELRQTWIKNRLMLDKLEATDEWAVTRRAQWNAHRDLCQLQQDGFREVVAPLEPYVAIFVIFGIPAVVMSTRFCEGHSGATADSAEQSLDPTYTDITYGDCNVYCEFVLSFRSLASAVAFFVVRERRRQLWDVHSLYQGLKSRILRKRRSKGQTVSSDVPLYDFASSGEDSPHWQIAHDDITLARRIAEGAFGIVWEGIWNHQRVAIKVLKASAVDEDGDLIDESSEREFKQECAMLRCLNHPNLLRFYGFGETHDGRGFIVTDLASNGALRNILLDSTLELPWPQRVSIAKDIAQGMAHLHNIPIIHRDLKPANVLLDYEMTALVADFGSSRQFRPLSSPVIFSAFTGASRVVPANSAGDVVQFATASNKAREALLANIGSAHGTLTKAVGTLLWMAPEVFRGDQHYDSAVDVYSYGLILWQLATRRVPWDDFGENLSYLQLLDTLTNALQSGRRPSVPKDVAEEHSEFVALFRSCWSGDATDRPSFCEVCRTLSGNSQLAHNELSQPASTDPLREPLLS